MFPVELRGERIVLREVSLDDLDAALAFASDPEVTRWLPFPTQTRGQEEAALKSMMTEQKEKPRVQYQLAATLGETGEMVGMGRIGLTPAQHQAADIGYGLRREWWGRGLGTEVASLLVAFGFIDLGVHRIWAGHHPQNDASGRVLEKAGMVREGRIREHMLVDGVWRDSITWSILEQEWRARHR